MKATKLSSRLLLLSLLSTGSAWATNGYFAHGYSAKEKGRAGTGVARGADSLASANNPANLLDVGDRIEAGAAFFMPFRSYDVTGGPSAIVGTPVIGVGGICPNPGVTPCQIPFSIGPQQLDSDREFFLIPSFGYSKQLAEDMAFGIAVYGNGGMNTEYDGGTANLFNPTTNTIVQATGTFGAGTAGVDLTQLFINNSLAYKVNETVSIGGGLIIAIQAFEATGIAPFQNNSLHPDKLSNNGHDLSYGAGIKLGATFKLSDKFSIGVSYQSEMAMTEFDDYAGLFAEAGDFDIPSTYTLGLVWDISNNSSFYFDLQEISYSEVKAIANGIDPMVNPANPNFCNDALNNMLFGGTPIATGSGCLGGADGAGFGWDDMTVYKLGYEWGADNQTFRVGFSTNDQPIPEGEVNFNMLAPGVVEEHYTAGYSFVTNGKQEWDFHFMYAPEVSVTALSKFDPAQTIKIQMDQLELGFSYKF